MNSSFMIGNMENPPSSDSQGRNGLWCVNCVNMWAATLGNRLNPINAVIEHLVIILHELTHAMSDMFHEQKDDPDSWDLTLWSILSEFVHKSEDDVLS